MDINQELKTGTTIMAVCYKNGVVMGADSRATSGSYVANRVTDKLEPIHKRIICCRSGSSADTQAIADFVRYYLTIHSVEIGKLPKVETTANLFKEFCYTNKKYLMASIICGGWDEENGGSVFQVPLGGSLVKVPFAIGGSGSTYIYGYCDSNYRKNMSREECEKFVLNGLTLAMKRDGSSGGIVRMATIEKEGITRQKFLQKDLPKFYEG